jgi:hypothetical protein
LALTPNISIHSAVDLLQVTYCQWQFTSQFQILNFLSLRY